MDDQPVAALRGIVRSRVRFQNRPTQCLARERLRSCASCGGCSLLVGRFCMLTVARKASGCDGNYSQRTAGAADDFQWRGDDNGAGWRKLIQVGQTGQPKFAAAVHQIVVWEGGIKGGGLTGISPDRFHADA